jgi:hypothetical protein
MRTLLIAALLLTAMPCMAGEAAKPTKAEQIQKLEKRLAALPVIIKDYEKQAADNSDPMIGKNLKKLIENHRAEAGRIPVEIAWLRGEVTLAGCEAKVKAAQEAVDKAAEKAKPDAQKALDKARAELELVKGFEARGEF